MELFADYVTTPGIVPSSACNPTTLASKHPRQPDDVARLPWFELDIRGVWRRSIFSLLLDESLGSDLRCGALGLVASLSLSSIVFGWGHTEQGVSGFSKA